MENYKIELSLNDWLYNSGIVGLFNILSNSNDNVEINNYELSFDLNVLENFETKYFNYFVDTYSNNLAWYRVIEYKNIIEYHEKENYINFNKKSLEKLNDYIDYLKRIIKSNSHVAAYIISGSEFDYALHNKQLAKIKLKKKENINDVLEKVKAQHNNIKNIISYYELPDSQKFIKAKNVIYNIINKNIGGVSFLNANATKKDMYDEYKSYFLEDTIKYVESDKNKYKYNCSICNGKINKIDINLSFLNKIGFDVARKSSHVWNFINDINICPVCKLVYSCIPAGFTYVGDKGLFINANRNINSIININKDLKFEMLNSNTGELKDTFKSLVNAINKKENELYKYNLSDIQVVRYENEKYQFNVLTERMINIFINSKKELDNLIKAGYKENKNYYTIFDNVVENIMNNQNQFLYIHKLLVKILDEDARNNFFGCYHVDNIMKINFDYYKGGGYMADTEKTILDTSRGTGYYLRQLYIKKGSSNKLNGISYKLLNALKTNNVNMFMDVILNCYLYVGEEVPPVFLETLKDSTKFKVIGYAFVSGLINGTETKKGE